MSKKGSATYFGWSREPILDGQENPFWMVKKTHGSDFHLGQELAALQALHLPLELHHAGKHVPCFTLCASGGQDIMECYK